MRNKTIDKMIPIAIKIINEEKYFKDGIPSVFNGYISSFGANIIQSGLVPTIAFFINENSNAEENRGEIVKLIEKIIKNMNGKYVIKKTLLETAIEEDNDDFVEYVKNAAVALKLSIRTFKFKKED